MQEVRRTGLEHHEKNGLRFTQYMDLDTDMAFYQDMYGNLLMKVDSNGRTYNAQDELIGKFEMVYPRPHANSHSSYKWNWKFVSNIPGTSDIEHPSGNLFDVVEPHVVGILFGSKKVIA